MNNPIDNLGDISLDSDIMHKIEGGDRKEKIEVGYDIFSYIWCVAAFFFPKVAIVSSTVTLLGKVLKHYLNHLDLKNIHLLEINFPQNDEIFHEFAGLSVRLKTLKCKIDCLEESTQNEHDILKVNVFNSVSDIGLQELGSLKNRIKSLAVPFEDNLRKCPGYLTLFARTTVVRQLLISRCTKD